MTTTADTRTFVVRAIPAELLASVRATGLDVSGHPVESHTAGGGEPLRCCLRDAEPGERLMLFGYEPPLPASPYREIGPVFAHAHACPGPSTDAYPPQWRSRPQVFRAYDARGRIHPTSRVHDTDNPEPALAEILADPEVTEIHCRNITYGCYMSTIVRPSTPDH
ncbi:DUF1203 domain-containing protein (plasmid) [Embleya sp. NBC_00888]|uniref:DUF1203 domain-containing protein n=1 Tax=Embleya sp. NBC_00888 TaxID=2975960 RepID=UPI002F9145A9|nr:DUF1203 domain-containing protein [Embleya sp. NBC_00888]